MALVVITLQDEEDGSIDVKLTSEPPLPGRNTGRPFTDAQTTALGMLTNACEGAVVQGAEVD